MNTLIILPVLIPMLTGAFGLLAWRHPRTQRIISLIGSVALLVTSIVLFWTVWTDGIQVMYAAGWPAPFGISFVADVFSAVMVLMAGLIGSAVVLYSMSGIDRRREAFGFHPLVHILLMGVCGAFLTGDIFNLYVWFEVLLIASFVLLALGGERAQLEGSIKYVTLNLISSAIFLAAIGLLYGEAGSLNMADLAVRLVDSERQPLTTALAMMFLVAFGIKGAIFPLFFWMPASYHTPPVVVSAVFAALLSKVGIYSIVRMFTLIFTQDVNLTHTLILVTAGLTMVVGVLGAIAQNTFRRMLSFLIIAEIGFLLMGVGLYTEQAISGTVFFMVHAIITMSTLFLFTGFTRRIFHTHDIRQMGGMYRIFPMLSIVFLIPAFGLAGLPPMAGFFAKVSLLQAAVATESWVILMVALVVSLLILIPVSRLWSEVFWKDPPEASMTLMLRPQPLDVGGRWVVPLVLPVVVLASLTLILGLFAEPVLAVANEAAAQLMNPEVYIDAVLGDQP